MNLSQSVHIYTSGFRRLPWLDDLVLLIPSTVALGFPNPIPTRPHDWKTEQASRPNAIMWSPFLFTVLLASPGLAATTSSTTLSTSVSSSSTPPTSLTSPASEPTATPTSTPRTHWELHLFASRGCAGPQFQIQGYDPFGASPDGCLNDPPSLPANSSAETSCAFAYDNGQYRTNCSQSQSQSQSQGQGEGAATSWPTAAQSLRVVGGTCIVFANNRCELDAGQYREYDASQGCMDLVDGGTDELVSVGSMICGVRQMDAFACNVDQDCVDAGIQCEGPDWAWEVVCSPETTCQCEPAGWLPKIPATAIP